MGAPAGTRVRTSKRKSTLLICKGDQRARRRHVMEHVKLGKLVQAHHAKGAGHSPPSTSKQGAFQQNKDLPPRGVGEPCPKGRQKHGKQMGRHQVVSSLTLGPCCWSVTKQGKRIVGELQSCSLEMLLADSAKRTHQPNYPFAARLCCIRNPPCGQYRMTSAPAECWQGGSNIKIANPIADVECRNGCWPAVNERQVQLVSGHGEMSSSQRFEGCSLGVVWNGETVSP